jgi:hypothetical protein
MPTTLAALEARVAALEASLDTPLAYVADTALERPGGGSVAAGEILPADDPLIAQIPYAFVPWPASGAQLVAHLTVRSAAAYTPKGAA